MLLHRQHLQVQLTGLPHMKRYVSPPTHLWCIMQRSCTTSGQCFMVQPTVTFPIGDHVNVLHDYKKTGPSNILKLFTCLSYHLFDMLLEFSRSLILLTYLKCLNVPYPSIFTNFCMKYYTYVPCGQTFFRLLKSSKNPHLYCKYCSTCKLANVPGLNTVMLDDMIVLKITHF